MSFISERELRGLRERFSAGTRVELVRMNDPYNRTLVPGSKGTVLYVDDAGSIHVRWDCGSGLAVVYGEDECRRIEVSSEDADGNGGDDSMINLDRKEWAFSEAEKYAVRWLEEHGFAVTLQKRYVTVDYFRVSKNGVDYDLRLPLGDSRIDYKAFMEQFDSTFKLYSKLKKEGTISD